jgi:nicotinate-nucleotide pyrophosphorylase (carboxylating)
MTGDIPNELLQQCIHDNVAAALREDIGTGDLTAKLVPATQQAHAEVVIRQNAVICGQPWFDEVFAQLDPAIEVRWHTAEGHTARSDTVLCEISGPARTILTGERSALNFLQLLSATATTARQYTEAIAGTAVRILDTRKTIPGLRLAQKYAVRCGGAQNHRVGLFDAILIKENHIVAAGDIRQAVATARTNNDGVLLEVEVETELQLKECFAAQVDRVLLDNFSAEQLKAAVQLRDDQAPGITLEASGGITLANIRQIAGAGIDFISVGALTKDIQAIDLSMRFRFTN